MATPRVLAVDVGGTSTRVAIADGAPEPGGWRVLKVYPSAAFDGLASVLRRFAEDLGTPLHVDAAGLGVAGPVQGRRCVTTNLPWVVDADAISADLGGVPVRLLNDFEANAWGVVRLGPTHARVLHPGTPVGGAPIAVLGAGTGLGEAAIIPTPHGPVVLPTEGGHHDFGPRDEIQDALLTHLRARHGHVSWERVASGMALPEIHAFLVESCGMPACPEVDAARASGASPGPVIGEHGAACADPACAATLDVFLSAYGAEAGNMVLRLLARGGVYLAGGIAPKLGARLWDGTFVDAYVDKGRYRDLVASVPVYLVDAGDLGLIGAAFAAVSTPAA